jgi:hypothetical protein
MAVHSGQPADLRRTFWGQETGSFDIFVEDPKVVTFTLDSNRPAAFYDWAGPLPLGLTEGKAKVTVKFKAHPDNTASGLFGLRVVEHRWKSRPPWAVGWFGRPSRREGAIARRRQFYRRSNGAAGLIGKCLTGF